MQLEVTILGAGAQAQAGNHLQVYYTMPAKNSEVRGYWCHSCHTDHKGEHVVHLDSGSLLKSQLEKRKNDEEVSPAFLLLTLRLTLLLCFPLPLLLAQGSMHGEIQCSQSLSPSSAGLPNHALCSARPRHKPSAGCKLVKLVLQSAALAAAAASGHI